MNNDDKEDQNLLFVEWDLYKCGFQNETDGKWTIKHTESWR